jgi:hypothetical protein
MGLKAALSKVFAFYVNRQLNHVRQNAVPLQQKAFSNLFLMQRILLLV